MSSIEQVQMTPGQLTGQVLFYSRPEPLSVETHGKLRLKELAAPYAFAAAAHAVPLQVSEFGPASMFYPIIFAGGQRTPMAIMGLRPQENLFVAADGRFEEGGYIPAFVRRYPFVLAGSDGQDQLVVCIDRDAPMIGEDGETPLFKDGKLSPFSEGAVEFCRNFETERLRTEHFVKRLTELDLFEPKAAAFTPRNPDGSEGPPVQIADYFAVTEEKVAALSDSDLREMLTSGALRQLHCHMNSMLNWDRLMAKAATRGPMFGNA